MIKYAGAEFSISPANRKQMPTAVPNKKHKKEHFDQIYCMRILKKSSVCQKNSENKKTCF
jgi:hypothetical protein